MADEPSAIKPNEPAAGGAALVPQWILVGIWTEPVFFVTFVGPLVLISALRIARGDFNAASEDSEVLAVLNQATAGGIVDYVIQFYTALLGWTLLVFKIAHSVVIPHIRKKNPRLGATRGHTMWFLLVFSAVFCVGFWIFFCGGGAGREMLEAYARDATPIGQPHLPVVTRLLVLRVFIGIQAIWMVALLRR
jgi:hypothetical protein